MDLQSIQVAIKQIAAEKGLSEESIMETINSALAAAYRKDFGDKNQNIIFEFDPKSGKMKVSDKKNVVDFDKKIIALIDENGRDKKWVEGLVEDEESKSTESAPRPAEVGSKEVEDVLKFNPKTDILLEDAKKIKKTIKVGDELIQKLDIPEEFGRMAAQTAKQVIIQKIREAERENMFKDFKDKEGELLIGVVQRRDMRGVLIDIGKATAMMPFEEQIKTEHYNPGERMKFYLKAVNQTIKGPEIIVSRSSSEMIKKLFETEIPEIASEAIDIMAIAREAGARSKVAVKSNQENIDPIGSCVGQRGARIQTIINEIGGEKIDIIEWAEDPAKFIANSLSPANVASIDIDEKEKTVTVTVDEEQLSLAIGKEGQNVRLAAKLTGWKINIMKETSEGKKEKIELEAKDEKSTEDKKKTKKSKDSKEKKTSSSASTDAKALADKKASSSANATDDKSDDKKKESKLKKVVKKLKKAKTKIKKEDETEKPKTAKKPKQKVSKKETNK